MIETAPQVRWFTKKLSKPTRLPTTRPITCLSWGWQLALVASVASVSMGYNLSVMNTPFPFVAADFGWCGQTWPTILNTLSVAIIEIPPLCPNAQTKQSFVNGCFVLCCAVGSFISGPLMTWLGRRSSLILLYSLMCVAVALGGLSWHFSQLIASRMLAGVASGMATVIPGVYMTEMAPAASRPFYSTIPQLAVNVGILLGICMGLFLHAPVADERLDTNRVGLTVPEWAFNRLWWRVMLAALAPICLVPLVLLLRLYFFETPAHLRLIGRDEEACELEQLIFLDEKSSKLLSLLPSSDPGFTTHGVTTSDRASTVSGVLTLNQSELSDMSIFTNYPSNNSAEREPVHLAVPRPKIPRRLSFSSLLIHFPSSWRQLLCSSTLRSRLFVGVALAMAQQLTGVNVFMTASNSIFAAAGVPADKLSFASLAMAVLGLICAFVAPWYLGKLRRRVILVGGPAGMALSFAPVLLCNLFLPSSSTVHQLTAVVSTLAFIVFYGLSYGSGLFLYLNELFPFEIKDAGLALAFTCNWLTGFVLVSLAPLLSQRHCFIIFETFCLFFAVFTYYFAPETKAALHNARLTTVVNETSQSIVSA